MFAIAPYILSADILSWTGIHIWKEHTNVNYGDSLGHSRATRVLRPNAVHICVQRRITAGPRRLECSPGSCITPFAIFVQSDLCSFSSLPLRRTSDPYSCFIHPHQTICPLTSWPGRFHCLLTRSEIV